MNVKLVIWDLDETFWKGTLSEGNVEKNEENIKIVKELVNRGIMNSIVSKNDFNQAMAVLKDWEVADYFVFPQITWEPKGKKVSDLLKVMKLRESNAVFIDDNTSNLHEVKYYNPDIITVLAKNFSFDMLANVEYQGKDDYSHSRLLQYQILEKRTQFESKYSSNEDFLRASNIKLSICKDCLNEKDRILELIQRTNQLNYTKDRLQQTELIALLKNKEYDCRYLCVKDDFGSYGIVGFYALRENMLEHFLFSCRIMGFGIENYIYKKLGYPDIKINGTVAVELRRDMNIDWIVEEEQSDNTCSGYETNCHQKSILMIGGCDLEQASFYLESEYTIKKEFSTVIGANEIRTSDSCQLLNAIDLSKDIQNELCENIPFMDKSVTFATDLFRGIHNIVIYSVVDDYIRGIYKHNIKGYSIGYGGYYDQEEFIARYSEKELSYLFKNFTFVGREDITEFKQNIIRIIESMNNVELLILINGIDMDVSDWIGKDRCNRNKEMNAVVDSIVSEYENVKLLDMRKIVIDRNDLAGNDNRHFKRGVYYKMALEITNIINDFYKENNISTNNRQLTDIKKMISHIIDKCYRFIKK